MSEILVTLGGVAAGAGSPLTPGQLLWINLLTDVFPALALALEPPEPDVMNHAPRQTHGSFIGSDDMLHLGLQAATMASGPLVNFALAKMRHRGLDAKECHARASASTFLALTLTQILHANSARSERHTIFTPLAGDARLRRNPYVMGAMMAAVLAQALGHSVPGLRTVLGTSRMDRSDLVRALASAVVPFVMNEATKTLLVWGRPVGAT
jgi:Ca2+-transporting ATPase